MKNRDGVTLLELLLAVSLLGLLSAGIMTALHVGLNALGKANARLMDDRRMTGVQRILEQEIAGFLPVIAGCIVSEERPPAPLPFFQGDPQSMRFVSTYSLEEGWRGYPHILEFQVIPGANGEGVRLVVNELPYTGPLSAGALCLGLVPQPELGAAAPAFRPIQTGPQSFILADRLASCRFSYRETLTFPALDRWVNRWVVPRWPSAVRIEMEPLAPGGVRVPPQSLTAPVRITEQPELAYAR